MCKHFKRLFLFIDSLFRWYMLRFRYNLFFQVKWDYYRSSWSCGGLLFFYPPLQKANTICYLLSSLKLIFCFCFCCVIWFCCIFFFFSLLSTSSELLLCSNPILDFCSYTRKPPLVLSVKSSYCTVLSPLGNFHLEYLIIHQLKYSLGLLT